MQKFVTNSLIIIIPHHYMKNNILDDFDEELSQFVIFC